MFNVRVLSRSYRKFISFFNIPFFDEHLFIAYTHLADFLLSDAHEVEIMSRTKGFKSFKECYGMELEFRAIKIFIVFLGYH